MWKINNKERHKMHCKKTRGVDFECPCDSIIKKGGLARHRKTRKHREFEEYEKFKNETNNN